MKQQIIRYLVRGGVLVILTVCVVIVSGVSGAPTDAQNNRHSSVTGYFGLDDEGFPIVNRNGIMLVFDGAIDPETVSTKTFEVYLDENTRLDVIETQVDGAHVFLKLTKQLPSDATPVVIIAPNEEIEDLAGNSTNRRKLGAVRIKDGIAPRLTVTLSGGSGTGTGAEGPDRLTNSSIDIHVVSDEPLQDAPSVIVVCKNLNWPENEAKRDIDDFIANRDGPHSRKPTEPAGTHYTCGYDVNGDDEDDPFELTEDIALARPGENWEFNWQNRPGGTTELQDGELVVIVFGRDRSRYERYGETVSNWATATTGFGLDTAFGPTTSKGNVRVHPPDGSVVREKRPFVLLEFPTEATVTLGSVIFDGVEIVDEFELVRDNEFVYWPLSMNQGEHEVHVRVFDSAGNETSFDFDFKSTQRGDFVIPLVAGWNAVSVPADPIDPKIESVFTNPSIAAVVSWDPRFALDPWAIAVRDGDAWTFNENFRGLTEIRAGSGYMVLSTSFSEQPITLTEGPGPSTDHAESGSGCGSHTGWWFVGVNDKEGNQTQDHFGEELQNSDKDVVTVRDYLAKFVRLVYTWDPIEGKYRQLEANDAVMIGAGIWYYSGGAATCP